MALSVLVVEDNDEWSRALCRMYQDLLGTDEVDDASTVRRALDKLERRSYDLLSVDIIMKKDSPAYGDGRRVVIDAAERNTSRGLVCITGMRHDDELEVVLEDDETIEEVRMTLEAFLDRFFPGRHLLYHKHRDPQKTPQDNIRIITSGPVPLTGTRLRQLCGAHNRFEYNSDSDSWTLQFDGKELPMPSLNGFFQIHYLLERPEEPISALDLLKLVSPDEARKASEIIKGSPSGHSWNELRTELQAYEKTIYRVDMAETSLDIIGELLETEPEIFRLDDCFNDVKKLRDFVGLLKSVDAPVQAMRSASGQDDLRLQIDRARVSIDATKALSTSEVERIAREMKGQRQAEPVKTVAQAVTRTIRYAIRKKIHPKHSALAEYLDHHIETGWICRYKPEEGVAWIS